MEGGDILNLVRETLDDASDRYLHADATNDFFPDQETINTLWNSTMSLLGRELINRVRQLILDHELAPDPVSYVRNNHPAAVALFSTAWHEDVLQAPFVGDFSRSWSAFAERQRPELRLAIFRNHILLEHRAWFTRHVAAELLKGNFHLDQTLRTLQEGVVEKSAILNAAEAIHLEAANTITTLTHNNHNLKIENFATLEELDRTRKKLRDVEAKYLGTSRALAELEKKWKKVQFHCQCAIYRPYLETLIKKPSGSQNSWDGTPWDKKSSTEKWMTFWEGKVKDAVETKGGPVWELLKSQGHPEDVSILGKVRSAGKTLYRRLSEQIHKASAKKMPVESIASSEDWNKLDKALFPVLKQMAEDEDARCSIQ